MANIASPVALVVYNPVSDTASISYRIPVSARKTSLLPKTLGTSDNANVSVNESGLLDSVNVLDKAGVVNYLAAQAGATATGLLVAGSGFVSAAVAAAGANQAGGTAITKDFSIVTSGTGGVTLFAITPCRSVRIINNTAAAVNVYPAVGDYIGSAAVNVAYSLGAGDTVILYSFSTAVANTTTAVWQRLQ
jgi:hypothetical protein